MPPLSAIEAVAAVIASGSFDAAANRLGITASAISQRVKNAEDQLGVTLIVRGRPCTGTLAGHRLARFVSELQLLRRDLIEDFGMEAIERPTIPIAVNADSLATWFFSALAEAQSMLFTIAIVNEESSSELLRKGEVLCSLGKHGAAIAGCEQIALGALRYVAVARPDFSQTWFPDGVTETTLGKAPSLRFGIDDGLQDDWVRNLFDRYVSLPHHTIPSSQGFIDACLGGLGWGLIPLQTAKEHIADGSLVELKTNAFLDLQLSWRWSRAATRNLKQLNMVVKHCAAKSLIQIN